MTTSRSRVRLLAALAISAFATVAAFGATAQAQSAPSRQPASTSDTVSAEDGAVTALAKDILHRLQRGTFDRSVLAADYNRSITDGSLAEAGLQLAGLGEPQRFHFVEKVSMDDLTAYAYHVRLEHGTLDIVLAIDDANKIERLLFVIRRSATTAEPTT